MPRFGASDPGARRRAEVEVDGRLLRVTNLDKVLYPVAGFTKGQVIDYYSRVAPALLPHLRGRALTLRRFPDGAESPGFYAKNRPPGAPDWVRTVALPTTGGRHARAGAATIDYLLVDDLPTLVWCANLAALELHQPQARAAAPRQPTQVVLDLDPGLPADMLDCCEVALWLRAALDRLGLPAHPKTSGSKGLALYVGIEPGPDDDSVKGFALALAELLERAHPDRVVSRMSRELRGGKVLVDWSQNDAAKTTIAPYSLRARPRPTVSTPVSWAEVEGALDAGDPECLVFEAEAVLERVARDGDTFSGVLDAPRPLPELGDPDHARRRQREESPRGRRGPRAG